MRRRDAAEKDMRNTARVERRRAGEEQERKDEESKRLEEPPQVRSGVFNHTEQYPASTERLS